MILEAIIFGINCAISAVLYATNRTRIFKLLLIYWIALTIQFISFGLIQTFTEKLVVEALISNGLMLLWINTVILKILHLVTGVSTDFKKYFIITFGGIFLATIFALLGLNFTTVSILSTYPISISTIYFIIKTQKKMKKKSILLNLFSLLNIMALIHLMDYPFLRLVEWFAPYGFTVHTAIHVGLAVLLPLILMKQKLMNFNYEIKKSEEKFRGLIESSSDIIWEVTNEGNYSYISPQVENILGYNPDELIGKSPFSLMLEKEKETVENLFKNLLAQKKPFANLCNTYIHKKGHYIILESSGVAIIEPGGNVVGYRGIDRDVTNREKMQEQLLQSDKMKAIGQLAGGIAHDFNNMLGGIMSAAQLLQLPKRNLDKTGLKYVDIIINATERTADLTAKLLAFGHKQSEFLTTVNIHTIINDSFDIFKRTLDKNIVIDIKKDAELYKVTGNSSELQNALINIIINSSHAMLQGGSIEIITKNIIFDKKSNLIGNFNLEPGKYLQIIIKDNGCGISEGNLKKIFDPFFTTKDQGKGTGLGLSTVYGTIEDHKGAVTVNSEVGKGTTFEILLPVSEEIGVSPKTKMKTIQGTGKIFLVDDETIIRSTIKNMLEEMGYDVIVSKDGFEAVEIFKEEHSKIDLILMDMIMPQMNGRDAFYKMKEIDQNCKIIIASGFTQNENLEELKKAGLSGFISKPFNSFDISKLLAEVLVENTNKQPSFQPPFKDIKYNQHKCIPHNPFLCCRWDMRNMKQKTLERKL